MAVSLQDELARALQKQMPLVVMISLAGCPFCKVIRENYLGPMHSQQGLSVVQVDMHSKRELKNFSGTSLSHENMRRTWGIRIAPTLLFFGRNGTEVAPRLVGASIPDFYGAYLDERLQQAQEAIK
jgi:thioredoxin-related protein